MREINENTIIKNGKTFAATREDRDQNDESSQTFEEVFGDLSDSVFVGNLDLDSLNLSSLKGCPSKIKAGNFYIGFAPELKSLDHFPVEINKGYELFISNHLIQDLTAKDIKIYKDLQIVIWDDSSDLFNEKNILFNFSEYRRINGSFSRISAGLDPIEFYFPNLERLYSVYEKLGFDREKFERALELL